MLAVDEMVVSPTPRTLHSEPGMDLESILDYLGGP